MKLYLDPGHGGSDPGAVGNGLKEKDITLDIAKRIRTILLNEYKDIEINMSRTNDTTKSLRQRTNEANSWNADYYVSIHCNAAASGSANGYEDFIHNSLSNTSQTAKYRHMLHQEITKLIGLRNRGTKKANFHVLRETKMSAFLSENGFITNNGDVAQMKQTSWRQKVAQGHANGIAKAFNLRQKEKSAPKNMYKVIAGSFRVKKSAEKRVRLLSNKGIDSFVWTVNLTGSHLFRVQAGAFASKENAENQLRTIKRTGVDAYILKV